MLRPRPCVVLLLGLDAAATSTPEPTLWPSQTVTLADVLQGPLQHASHKLAVHLTSPYAQHTCACTIHCCTIHCCFNTTVPYSHCTVTCTCTHDHMCTKGCTARYTPRVQGNSPSKHRHPSLKIRQGRALSNQAQHSQHILSKRRLTFQARAMIKTAQESIPPHLQYARYTCLHHLQCSASTRVAICCYYS